MNDWNPNHYKFPRVSNHHDPRWMDNDLYDAEPPSNFGDKMTLAIAVLLLVLLMAGAI